MNYVTIVTNIISEPAKMVVFISQLKFPRAYLFTRTGEIMKKSLKVHHAVIDGR